MKLAEFDPQNWRLLQSELCSSTSCPFFGYSRLGDIVNRFIPYIFVFAGLALLLYLLYGGYQYMFSGGDPKKTQAAKDNITGALTGFAIIFAAYWIVRIAATVLGLTDILSTF